MLYRSPPCGRMSSITTCRRFLRENGTLWLSCWTQLWGEAEFLRLQSLLPTTTTSTTTITTTTTTTTITTITTTTTTTTHNIHLSFHIVRGVCEFPFPLSHLQISVLLFSHKFFLYFLSQRFSRFTSGRAGNDIEVEGWVMSLCDVWDWKRSRLYRETAVQALRK